MSEEQIDTMEDYINTQFSTINDTLTLFKMQISSVQKMIKQVEKDVRKELKNAKKESKIEKKSKRQPSGFAKPTKITKELCEFLGKPEDSEMARTEVTKALVNYIKENNLFEKSEESKNKIIPDDKLKTLLSIKDDEINDLTYFSIQKHMNKHFYTTKQTNKSPI